MRFSKAIIATSMIALLGACATAPGGNYKSAGNDVAAAPPPPPVVMAPPPPPLPSSGYTGPNGAITVTGNRIGRENYSSASPLTVISTETAQDAVLVGQVAPKPSPEMRYIQPVFVPQDPGNEQYEGEEVSPVKLVATEPLSTFSVDVDTGAYTNARRFLTQGQMPPRDSVRTEEMINYFRYDYAKPQNRDIPFSVNTDIAKTPWNAETRLMRIGLRGYDIPQDQRPAANLVFLLDVSGSMNSPDKLPLVKSAMKGLANQLTERDKVSIVVYAGAAGLVLEPTSNPSEIRAAIDKLSAGGSTAGGAGIELAYRIAEDNIVKGGVNRVILATDGDFNVGISDRDKLIELIEQKRETGITLTTLGFGTGNYNEALMEQIANKGNGNYAYIDSALEARKVLGSEMGSTIFTIAKDVKIQVEFNPAVISQYRLIGYENRALKNEDFDNDRVDAGDIGAGHQVTAIYEVVPTGAKGWVGPRRYDTPAKRPSDETLAEAAYIKLRYKMPDGDTSKLIDRIVPSAGLLDADAPRGDFAFAVAVAAFGQKLRKDDLLGDFNYRDIQQLAGRQGDFWRQEFTRLADVADSMAATQTGQSGG